MIENIIDINKWIYEIIYRALYEVKLLFQRTNVIFQEPRLPQYTEKLH